MSTRGERDFLNLPGFAARMYELLTKTGAIRLQHQEIAQRLTQQLQQGRLLDVGMGPGALLREVHRLNQKIELHGLDISDAMVALARKNLSDLKVDVRSGSIQKTEYAAEYFDLITCTGSFYLWDEPVLSLNEIYRILKPGRSAVLFESYRDFDEATFRTALQRNVQKEPFLRRIISPFFLRRQLRMTYTVDEITRIIQRTCFADTFTIEKVSIAHLPVWMCITLRKP